MNDKPSTSAINWAHVRLILCTAGTACVILFMFAMTILAITLIWRACM